MNNTDSNIIIVESSDRNNSILCVETTSIIDFGTIIVEKSDNNIEITTHDGIASYIIPENIPISHTSGNLPVSRIDGLSDYLNSYVFDCGTP